MKRISYVFCAALLIAAIHSVFAFENGVELLRIHVGNMDQRLGRGELLQFCLLLVLGLPAAIALSVACGNRLWASARSIAERGGFWTPVLLAALAAFCVARFVTDHAWFTDDEQAYFFQMLSIRRGMLTVPALQPEGAFHHAFVVVVAREGGMSLWAGVYPVLQPALMALSSLIAHPGLSQWLCVGLIVYHTGRLTETLSGNRGFGIGASWLCAVSPMLIGLGATYHNVVVTCLLSVAALRVLLAARQKPTLWRCAGLGLLVGFTFLARPLEGTLLGAIGGGCLLVNFRSRQRETFVAIAGFGLGALIPLVIFLGNNMGTTGSPLATSYDALERTIGRFFGFGDDMVWGRSHTPIGGLNQSFTTVMRLNMWLFGWPVSLLVPLLAITRSLRTHAALWLLVLSVVQLAAYFPLAFGGVHDFGNTYHLWHLPWMAAATMLVVQRAAALSFPAARSAAVLSVVGLLAFWPARLQHWHSTSELTLAPVRAAAEATAGVPAIVLWRTMQASQSLKRSWVYFPPAPFPENLVLWARDYDGAEDAMRTNFPERRLFRLSWRGQKPVVSEVPPAGPRGL